MQVWICKKILALFKPLFLSRMDDLVFSQSDETFLLICSYRCGGDMNTKLFISILGMRESLIQRSMASFVITSFEHRAVN